MKINGVNVHESLTESVILEAAESGMFRLESPGFCILCGIEHDGIEPDAEKYPCQSCGAPSAVYGAEQLVIYFVG